MNKKNIISIIVCIAIMFCLFASQSSTSAATSTEVKVDDTIYELPLDTKVICKCYLETTEPIVNGEFSLKHPSNLKFNSVQTKNIQGSMINDIGNETLMNFSTPFSPADFTSCKEIMIVEYITKESNTDTVIYEPFEFKANTINAIKNKKPTELDSYTVKMNIEFLEITASKPYVYENITSAPVAIETTKSTEKNTETIQESTQKTTQESTQATEKIEETTKITCEPTQKETEQETAKPIQTKCTENTESTTYQDSNINTDIVSSPSKSKKNNPLKVTKTKKKTIKNKALKKRKITIKPIKIKKAVGKVTVTKVKKGTNKRIYKKIKVNSKTGKITFKKGNYNKKNYVINLKVRASGNTSYKGKTITKKIKVKIK